MPDEEQRCEDLYDDPETAERAQEVAIRRKQDLPPSMHKYWHARHDLFSRFSEGILLDEESWFSVTPEAVAYRLATQCACEVILDAFCGAGGNAIQFAMTCGHVVAIDIDPLKIALARNNAAIYGVEDRITFLCGDFCDFARARAGDTEDTDRWQSWHRRKIDVVFLSPPWGGVDYLNPALSSEQKDQEYTDIYPLSLLRPVGGRELFRLARTICDKIVFYLPRNVDLHEVDQLTSMFPNAHFGVQVEELWLGYKLKALAVYWSEAQGPCNA